MRACWLLAALAVAAPASAQSFTFDRTLSVGAASALDILTERGKIDVTSGDAGQIVIQGTVRVRARWNVPARAAELAKAYADHPTVGQVGNTIRLRPPSDQATRDAVTVSYQIRVPRATSVSAISDSGAIAVSGVAAPVTVRTESSAIGLENIGSTVDVETGSGSVKLRDLRSAVRVSTDSGAIVARDLGGALHARTGSGAVDACFKSEGDVDVRTSSSEILLCGVNGAVAAETSSGHIGVRGAPIRPWTVTTGSSRIDVSLEDSPDATLDASSGSGLVNVTTVSLNGTIEKRLARGTIGNGGPLVRLTSRSGAVYVTRK